MAWYKTLVWIWIAVPIMILPILLKINVPYGRHAHNRWGPVIDNHWGWFWMEFPALLTFPLLAMAGPQEKDLLSRVLIGLWLVHYTNRVFVFPFRIKTKGKKMPLLIAVSAIFFNLTNGFVNGYYIGFVNGKSGNITNAFALLGIVIFFIGFAINNFADLKLISLRKNGNGYQIPRGWLFEYISCPNHFGEIVEWIGFAIAARSLPALSFAVWTFCNLAPRANNHHRWYIKHFEDYPKKRKVVLPWIW
ncbi:MAG: DUF1295 domain-containing protein [Cytophagales bacterium]|nr:DUF1295 domain-containing protein [Cytophagales bacterium]